MTVAYCIAAHTKPAQCGRLVRRLLDDDPDLQGALALGPAAIAVRSRPGHQSARVQIVPQRAVHWGSKKVVDLFEEMFRIAVAGKAVPKS